MLGDTASAQQSRPDCLFCTRDDTALQVVQVWQDQWWRLLVDLSSEVLGFSVLSPHRHVADVTDLSPDEGATFGPALGKTSAALKAVTGSSAVYVYIFDHPHLHVHLGPHQPHDALNHQIIRGEMVSSELASGLHRDISKDFPIIAEDVLRETASRIRSALA